MQPLLKISNGFYKASQEQVQELARLNQLKDDFLSTVSHELRTPMSNIKMATQMLEVILKQLGILNPNSLEPSSKLNSDYGRVEQYFQILNTECKRETNLINDLLDLSRVEAEADPLIWTTIQLQDWIPAIAEPFEYKTQAQNQQLQLNLEPDLPPLTTDLQYLERILLELLQNACKYTPAGETISVAVRVAPMTDQPHLVSPMSSIAAIARLNWSLAPVTDHAAVSDALPPDVSAAALNHLHAVGPPSVQIIVRNTGVEIPLTELDHVFDKFYRIPNQDPWKYSGTGLGLALTQKLVERLHGAIVVTSEPGYTQFTITLPLNPHHDSAQ